MLHIGFDVGGTNIAAGAVDATSMEIVARRSIPFPTGVPYEETAKRMAGLAAELAAECGIDCSAFGSAGVAVPGSLSPDCTTVLDAHNLQFHDVPLKSALEALLPCPVYLANDANAAALAELHAGAFRGHRTAALITLGTGIGGGLILGGRMFNGGLGHGVELGHMVLAHGGPLCTCGTRGCIETLCTATWLIQQGRRAVVDYPLCRIATDAGGDMDRVTAKLVIDCAKAGDAIAAEIFERYVDQLGSTVASFINLLDPEVIAIGGGVSHAGEYLFAPLRANVEKKSFFDTYGEIVPAALGNDAGIVGAAMLFSEAI